MCVIKTGCRYASGSTVRILPRTEKKEADKMVQSMSRRQSSEYEFLLRRPSAILETQFEEAILSIGSAMTAIQFRDAVKFGLNLALPNMEHSLVLLLDVESGELAYFETDSSFHLMPKSGVVWEVARRRTADIFRTGIPEDDPIRSLLPDLQTIGKDRIVVISPIVEKKQHRVVALLLAVCAELSVMHSEKLKWLERNVLVASSRVLTHLVAEREKHRAEDMLRVCGDLIDLDTASLTIKILKHLKIIMEVEMCLLFIIDDATSELVCQVYDENALDTEVRKPVHESLYGRCFLTGETLNISDVSKDVRFNPAVDLVNDYEPSTMLCMPVKVQREEDTKVIAVAVACNKNNKKIFSTQDEENMCFVLRFCASVLANTLAFQRELAIKKQNETFLQIAKNLFSNLSDLDVLLREIMKEAQSITNAEKCSLFLLDHRRQQLVATVFDSNLPGTEPLRIGVGQGIAGFVAKTGKTVNIHDAYKHPKFFRDVDKTTGFHTRNLLCFPITINNGDIVGVAQLVNKVEGKFFTKYDEELAKTFSVYCGISIHQSRLYREMRVSQGRSKICTELMIYHMKIPSEEVERVSLEEIPSPTSFHQRIREFTYYPGDISEADTILAMMSMADDLGLINRWKLQKETLARFLLMVKKGYRDPPYHNWNHAFSVAHFCYVLFKNCDELSSLEDMETLALFISCLCHDIDHRGTNNAFQVSSKSVLASLYSSKGSVMERHHFSQTLCILNSDGCNIFEGLSPADYKRMLDLIQANILSTDIASHLRQMKDMTQMGTVGFQPSNPTHHDLMCSLIMTSCDLCSSCKDWESSKAVSDSLCQEFFKQGDLEKELGVTPIEMMDREKAFLPEQQVGFLDGIAGPAYKVLVELLPAAGAAYESLQENRRRWVNLKKEGRRTSTED